jgi:hypothetical protein
MPVSSGSSRSSLGMNSEAFASVHAGASSVMGAALTGVLLDCHSSGAGSLPSTLYSYAVFGSRNALTGSCRPHKAVL